jgi:hypothetical protein
MCPNPKSETFLVPIILYKGYTSVLYLNSLILERLKNFLLVNWG